MMTKKKTPILERAFNTAAEPCPTGEPLHVSTDTPTLVLHLTTPDTWKFLCLLSLMVEPPAQDLAEFRTHLYRVAIRALITAEKHRVGDTTWA